MTPASSCSRCGSDASIARRGGLCPRCLLDLGLSESDATTGAEDIETRSLGPSANDVPPTPPPADFTGPRRIAGYEILRQLGAGGMGTVFEAFDEKMDRRVALKVLSFRLGGSSSASRRFEQEAWIAGRLDHPNLVKVFERGTFEGHSYYSMELVDGGSLYDVLGNLKRWGRDDGLRLEFGSKRYVDWAIEQVITAARALDYAHRQGVVHRDVKPMNLLLGRESGALKIADFGLALDAEASRLTATGAVMGTLSYMAPEQLLGKRDEIDARADVYALGVTLFELLTLELPHDGETREAYMHSVLHSAARRARALNQRVSRDLETVIGRALERRPRDRYPTAAAFADDLDRVRLLVPIEARRPGPLERLWKWARRRPVHAALAATLIVATPLTALLGTRAVQHRNMVRAQSIVSLEQRILFLSQREDFAGIIETAGRLLELDPDNAVALRGRGIAALELALAGADNRAKFESIAQDDMERLVRSQPGSSGAYGLQEYVLDRLGHADAARRAGEQAERLRGANPSDEDLQVEGFVAYRRGDYQKAVTLLSDLLARSPQRLQALELRAQAWEKLGKLDRAIEDYRVFAGVSPELFRGRFELGRLYTAAGELDLGETQYLEARKLRPLNGHVHDGLAANALERGWAALGSGDEKRALEIFKEAEGLARRAVELEPALPEGHMHLGVSLMELDGLLGHDAGRVAEAASQYAEAARLLTERGKTDSQAYSDVQVNLCDLFIELGQYDRALATCREVIRRQPDDPAARYNLAAIHALSGRPDEALAELERDLALGDTDYAYLEGDAWFDSLRDDPRFVDLLRRMRVAASR